MPASIDNDVLGQAAVTVDGNDLLTGAELLGPPPAEGAVETRLLLVTDTDAIAAVQVGDLGTGFFDYSNDLVAGDQRIPRVTPIIIDELDVAPREAAMRDPHQDVTAANRPLIQKRLRRAAFLSDRICSDLHDSLGFHCQRCAGGSCHRKSAGWPTHVSSPANLGDGGPRQVSPGCMFVSTHGAQDMEAGMARCHGKPVPGVSRRLRASGRRLGVRCQSMEGG